MIACITVLYIRVLWIHPPLNDGSKHRRNFMLNNDIENVLYYIRRKQGPIGQGIDLYSIENPLEAKFQIYQALEKVLDQWHDYEVRVQDSILTEPKTRTIIIYDIFDNVHFKETKEIKF